MLADMNAVVARTQTVPALAVKTFKLVAPRNTAGVITAVAPYCVIQPADGSDTRERVTGPRSTRHPRFIFHIVGSSYDNCQMVTELLKAKFVVAGVAIQINVTGEKGRGLYWDTPMPTQRDDAVTPPLIYNTVEVGWTSDPIPA